MQRHREVNLTHKVRNNVLGEPSEGMAQSFILDLGFELFPVGCPDEIVLHILLLHGSVDV